MSGSTEVLLGGKIKKLSGGDRLLFVRDFWSDSISFLSNEFPAGPVISVLSLAFYAIVD
jgi:hypothetical protein